MRLAHFSLNEVFLSPQNIMGHLMLTFLLGIKGGNQAMSKPESQPGTGLKVRADAAEKLFLIEEQF